MYGTGSTQVKRDYKDSPQLFKVTEEVSTILTSLVLQQRI